MNRATRNKLVRGLSAWLDSREWTRLTFGIPALLSSLILVVVMTTVLYVHERPAELREHYHHLTRVSLATGQYEVARVACLRGLANETNERARLEWLFYLAVAMNGLGHEQESADLLTAAAPLDHPGYAEAHLLAAQTFLNSTNLTQEKLKLSEQHLRNALASEPRSVEANELLGRLYINLHQLDKARLCLLRIYATKPETALLIAVTYDLERDAYRAVPWADRAIMAIRARLIATAPNASPADRLDLIHALLIKGKYAPLLDPVERAMLTGTNAVPQDSPPVWLDLVRDLKRAEKYAPALETLERASRASPNPVYPPAIADICATWAEKIPTDQNVERLRLIQEGLDNASNNLKLWWLLIQASHVADASGVAAKKLLDETVAGATGQAAAWWYFLLWTDARTRGDLATARSYLKTAYKLAPQIPQIQNDLAMDQSTTGSREDLARALTLIQPVVEKFPNNPGFRDTRGRILAKLGRNQESVADLQFAASRMPNSAGTREILARVYAALGQTQPVFTNSSSAMLGRIHNLMLQGNYATALETLEQANRASPNPVFSSAIADVCAIWVDYVLQNGERLQLIQKGLNNNPDNEKLRSLLLKATEANDATGPAARRLLERLVKAATGVSAAQWHLLLGRDALARGNPAAAKQHLQTAYELAPTITQIQSDLALALANGNKQDLERGLVLIDSVLDWFPENPEFRNTRGVILARFGRNQEAVADLQFAATKLASPKETRLLLAKVYEALGKTKLDEQQRRLAESDQMR